MLVKDTYKPISSLLRVLGHPIRIQILEEIGNGEACVCHLETKLGIRQAYLSQHLMALRTAGVLRTRREGRFIFYRITDHRILGLVAAAAEVKGISMHTGSSKKTPCNCPKCSSKT